MMLMVLMILFVLIINVKVDGVNDGDGVDDGDLVDGASPGAGPTSTATSACSPWTTSRSSRTRGRSTSCWSTMIIARFIVIASED